MTLESKQIWIVRHAQTQWSADGRHTGRTDIKLTAEGEAKAEQLRPLLARAEFSLVLSSPSSRSIETARRAGLSAAVQCDDDLLEWDYGSYEGRRSDEITRERPGWDLWRDGCPGGEPIEAVARRASRVLGRCMTTTGRALLFSHGHFSRMLAACWLQLPASRGRSFGLKAGSISILGFEHGNPVIWQWDRVDGLEDH
ncbi:MAG: histidine phosphatase family protein [Phycisphaerales bacterium]|nr:histidine phosphatase family protein [Phycisphaerales bacterium]